MRVWGCKLKAAAVHLQAHLKADKFYSVIANMRGISTQEVASKNLQTLFRAERTAGKVQNSKRLPSIFWDCLA